MNFIRQNQILRLGLLFSLLPALASYANSITLVPSADTTLFFAVPDNNLGATGNLVVGGNGGAQPGRGLVRFDLTGQLPAGAVVQSVSLTVKVVTVPSGGGGPSMFNVHRVLRDWGEGAGTSNTGSTAITGEATWNNCFHPATPWSAPGGALTKDFAPTVSAALRFTSLGSYTFESTPGLLADVELWRGNSGTNFGWVLISELENTAFTAKRIGSRENIGNEPKLTVSYILPPAPDILWVAMTNGQVRFSFVAQAGQPYTVQYSTNETSNGWTTFASIGPQTATTNLMVTDLLPHQHTTVLPNRQVLKV